MTRLHAFISGRVQMVGFRYNTRNKAEKLGITGWVKNLKDGRVEVIAEGSSETLDIFEKWLHQGPRSAKVTEVHSDRLDTESKYDLFCIQY